MVLIMRNQLEVGTGWKEAKNGLLVIHFSSAKMIYMSQHTSMLAHCFEPQLLTIYVLASSGPYGPLLARYGYPGQGASFYNNEMVMISVTVNAPTLM